MKYESDEQCWKYLADNWTVEEYAGEKERYKNMLTHILDEKTPSSVTCYCGMIWDDKKMVSCVWGCGQCDKMWRPFLANPRNKNYVLKYIPKKYHCHLLEPESDEIVILW